MAISVVLAAKAAVAVLTNEKARKKVGWVIAAILSPLILVIAALCCIGQGGAEHNNAAVTLAFNGGTAPSSVDTGFSEHIKNMQSAFAVLDCAVYSVESEGGITLDNNRIKSVFYSLRFDDYPLSLSASSARNFVDCFVSYTTETSTETNVETGETYEVSKKVITPVDLNTAYSQLAALGMSATHDDRENAAHIYALVSPTTGGSGTYEVGSGQGIELDASAFVNAEEKNNQDLVTYAIHAWESGWGYVWGTFGDVLTESLFTSKLNQYPDNVGRYADFIRANWLGGRTTDCVGLIKGYGWLNPETLAIGYGINGMLDVSADGMYNAAAVKGSIYTIPDTPGLAVWHAGHIGVYIGNGEVIEAMGTKYGVVKTKLSDRNWTAWLEIPYIAYYD